MKRLVIRPGAIGDFIVCIPALNCLRDGYLEIWAAGPNVPLAARIADRARGIASTGIDLLELTGASELLMVTLRAFDSIVSWYGAGRPEFRNAVKELGLPFHFLEALPPEGCGLHATDFYLRQVAGLRPGAGDGIPRIGCEAIKSNVAVIHPFAGSPKKRWPIERFRELEQQLAGDMKVEWCAGPEDDLEGARRFDNLYELACWFSAARVYIGNDSGPTHLAAAVGTPVVALFGPTDPAVWAPRGANVSIVAASRMNDIPVERVVGAVRSALSTSL